MYTTGYELKTDADFDNVIMFSLPIDVIYKDTGVTEFSGFMIRHSILACRFAPRDTGYVKETHIFKVR